MVNKKKVVSSGELYRKYGYLIFLTFLVKKYGVIF